ncbi:MAG: hypothetical protein A3F46_05880 [Legionellales bacterium RIFCSPHIGHO2_12_FULL_42_9]|nr:MAG: hypothetical protein A3F46_05880 [Legionellales bacterium RIFCSPHIGHO2_12_FULL_42_9]
MNMKHNLLGIQFFLLTALIGFVCPLSFANQHQVSLENNGNQVWFTQNSQHKHDVQLRVDLFLSTTCPHCRAANHFFHQLETKKPWLSVHRYYINKDKVALDRLNDLVIAQQIKINPFAVPAIFFCDARWLGFDNTHNIEKEILKELSYCHKQIVATGLLTPMTVNAIRKAGVSEWYQSNIVGNPSWSELIVTLAGFDVLMSCSLLGFLVMFAFLFLIPKKNLRLVFGGLFLFCVGLIHYLQQVYTAFFYELIQGVRWPAVGVGLLLLGFIISCYCKKIDCLKLTCTLKGVVQGVVMLLSVALVYSYYQGCLPNYSLVFQHYLVAHTLTTERQFVYTLLYQIVYLLALALLLVIALIGSARVIKYQQVLRKLVCLVLLFSALFLIIYPLLLE